MLIGLEQRHDGTGIERLREVEALPQVTVEALLRLVVRFEAVGNCTWPAPAKAPSTIARLR